MYLRPGPRLLLKAILVLVVAATAIGSLFVADWLFGPRPAGWLGLLLILGGLVLIPTARALLFRAFGLFEAAFGAWAEVPRQNLIDLGKLVEAKQSFILYLRNHRSELSQR